MPMPKKNLESRPAEAIAIMSMIRDTAEASKNKGLSLEEAIEEVKRIMYAHWHPDSVETAMITSIVTRVYSK